MGTAIYDLSVDCVCYHMRKAGINRKSFAANHNIFLNIKSQDASQFEFSIGEPVRIQNPAKIYDLYFKLPSPPHKSGIMYRINDAVKYIIGENGFSVDYAKAKDELKNQVQSEKSENQQTIQPSNIVQFPDITSTNNEQSSISKLVNQIKKFLYEVEMQEGKISAQKAKIALLEAKVSDLESKLMSIRGIAS